MFDEFSELFAEIQVSPRWFALATGHHPHGCLLQGTFVTFQLVPCDKNTRLRSRYRYILACLLLFVGFDKVYYLRECQCVIGSRSIYILHACGLAMMLPCSRVLLPLSLLWTRLTCWSPDELFVTTLAGVGSKHFNLIVSNQNILVGTRIMQHL